MGIIKHFKQALPKGNAYYKCTTDKIYLHWLPDKQFFFVLVYTKYCTVFTKNIISKLKI